MDTSLAITLEIVITVLAGISAQVVAEWLRVPGIVLLLLSGTLLGKDGLDLLHPSRLGNGLEVLVSLLVAVILFEGGFNLTLRDLGKVSGSLRNLITVGPLITLAGGAIAAHGLSEFPWAIAFLYAALVVVTGPTVVGPLLRQLQVDRQVATLLEGEGVLIDPIGAILAVAILNIVLNGTTDPFNIMSGLVIRLGLGGGIGAAGGWLLGWLLKRMQFLSEDLKNLVVLAGVWGLFGAAQAIRSESGLMATVVAGIVLQASSVPAERLLRRFKGQLTVLAISVLFVLLAADLPLASVAALGWGGFLTVLVLMFLVRPIEILLCTWNSDLNWQQKTFLCWISPRGIVSASVASLFSILLTEQGINGGEAIKALVFLTIGVTVVFQGLSARWVAQFLRLTSTERTGAVIVGCHPLSCLVARLFQDRGEPVVLIDTNPDTKDLAEQEHVPVLIRSALDLEALEEAELSKRGTFLAMTTNGNVNLLLAERVAEEFHPPYVLAVFPRDPRAAGGTSSSRVNQAFLPDLTIKVWNQYLLDQDVKLGETLLSTDTDFAFQVAHLQALVCAGELVPLALERDDRLQVVPVMELWQAGDRLIYLLHAPKPKLLKLLSGASQPRLTLDKLPEVETVKISPSEAVTEPAAEPIVVAGSAEPPVDAELKPEKSVESEHALPPTPFSD
jgi:NhaP-type Na+/H+ or K+/H+ antiporter